MIQQAALANPLSLMLDKERRDFTRADMLKVIRERGIERLSFHYTSVDGKLRELKLPFSDFTQAERILASGERVDGSSLFAGLVDAAASDLYVVPSYRTAFLSPFDSSSLNFICRFLDRDGQPGGLHPGQHPGHRPRAVQGAHRSRAPRPRRARVLPHARGRAGELLRPPPDRLPRIVAVLQGRRRGQRDGAAISPRSPVR